MVVLTGANFPVHLHVLHLNDGNDVRFFTFRLFICREDYFKKKNDDRKNKSEE